MSKVKSLISLKYFNAEFISTDLVTGSYTDLNFNSVLFCIAAITGKNILRLHAWQTFLKHVFSSAVECENNIIQALSFGRYFATHCCFK